MTRPVVDAHKSWHGTGYNYGGATSILIGMVAGIEEVDESMAEIDIKVFTSNG